ncbi:hypothetical protein [Rubrolithibacter danxiaensis]|uniref:hypothetical protein n=1 Tax=Rubrolithibacter danxiaensis TaxID=3390805 RepID=UPI003BF782BC
MNYIFLSFLSVLSLKSIAAIDTLKTQKPPVTVIFAAQFSNNANYYGQTTDEKLPYILTNASVTFPNGVWLSGGAYKLLNAGGGSSVSILGIGYDFALAKSLNGSVSYSYSFYPPSSPLLQAGNDNMASASLEYELKWFNTMLNADYAYGEEKDLFLTFTNSKFIDLGSLLTKKDYISLEPAIELVGGTQHFYRTYTTKRKGKSKKSKTTTVATQSFEFISYNLKLPVAYNRDHYSIEVGNQVSFLGKKVASYSNKPRYFLNLSFYYLF